MSHLRIHHILPIRTQGYFIQDSAPAEYHQQVLQPIMIEASSKTANEPRSSGSWQMGHQNLCAWIGAFVSRNLSRDKIIFWFVVIFAEACTMEWLRLKIMIVAFDREDWNRTTYSRASTKKLLHKTYPCSRTSRYMSEEQQCVNHPSAQNISPCVGTEEVCIANVIVQSIALYGYN